MRKMNGTRWGSNKWFPQLWRAVMRLLFKAKDGGPDSTVTGYWLFESKRFGSIALMRFDGKSREAYHSHAFNSVSWLFSGVLYEEFPDGKGHPITPSWKPIVTRRETVHKVDSDKRSWVLTFRGPWDFNMVRVARTR